MTVKSILVKTENIFGEFMKKTEQKRMEKKAKEDKTELLTLIAEAKESVMIARNNFNFATDERLLECKIYELKAAESRLGYFLKMAKESNVSNSAYVNKKSGDGGVFA